MSDGRFTDERVALPVGTVDIHGQAIVLDIVDSNARRFKGAMEYSTVGSVKHHSLLIGGATREYADRGTFEWLEYQADHDSGLLIVEISTEEELSVTSLTS